MPWGIKVCRKNSDIIGDVFSYGRFNEVYFDMTTYLKNLNAYNEQLSCLSRKLRLYEKFLKKPKCLKHIKA